YRTADSLLALRGICNVPNARKSNLCAWARIGSLWYRDRQRRCKPAGDGKDENQEFDPKSKPHERRARQGRRQNAVDDSLFLQTELGQHASVRIDDSRDASVGGVYHRQALLDGAKFSLVKMLIGTGA